MQSEQLQKIEQNAALGKPLPQDLKPPEVMLYYMLSGLYASYHAGKLTKEQGKTSKQQIYNTYQQLKTEYEQFTEICKLYQERIRSEYQS